MTAKNRGATRIVEWSASLSTFASAVYHWLDGKDWIKWFTLGLVIVGGIQARILYDQEVVTNEESRPWVGVEGLKSGPLVAGAPFPIVDVLKNSGGTPALRVTECITGLIVNTSDLTMDGSKRLMKILDACPKDSTTFYLLPQAEYELNVPVNSGPITQHLISDIDAGIKTIVVISKITYEAGDGQSHNTSLCGEYVLSVHNFDACPYGNDAD